MFFMKKSKICITNAKYKIEFFSKVPASDSDVWISGRRELDLDTLTQLLLFKVKSTIENTLLYNRTM